MSEHLKSDGGIRQSLSLVDSGNWGKPHKYIGSLIARIRRNRRMNKSKRFIEPDR